MMDAKVMRNRHLKALSFDEKLDELKRIYFRKLGEDLNLENPQTWNEKIQWLKVFDATQEKTDWTDKIKAKTLASQTIGEQYVVPLLHEGVKSPEEIDFDILPNQFVIKTNHGSGNIIIVKDKRKFLNSSKWKIAKNYLNRWMEMDYGYDDGFELHYSAIEPFIFAEAYVPALSNDVKEYRICCFEGEPRYIKVKTASADGNNYRNVYDTEWNFRPDVQWGPTHLEPEDKPAKLSEMLEIARKLSKGFHFVRVDLNYTSEGRIYFGELTFTSGSGFTRIIPKSFNLEMGGQLSYDKIRKSPPPLVITNG